MELALSDTVAALASPAGRGARGIIRVSGPDAVRVVTKIAQDTLEAFPVGSVSRRYEAFIRVADVDHAVPAEFYLWPTERSFTGQPMCEIHTIGAPPLLESVLQSVCRHGARPARQGEFTLRAFLSGKLDLMQAEAVLGVIDSTDDQELLNAVKQLGGDLSTPLQKLRGQLLDDLADLEAGLDFVEEDIDFVNRDSFIERLSNGMRLVSQLLEQTHQRGTTTGSKKVVLAGLPNAGKSTLFNKLIGENQAIVSNQSGTTRDFLTAQLDWDGLPIELVDTAGWESASEDIMEAAQKLRREQLENADLVCWCSATDIDPQQKEIDEELNADCERRCKAVLRVFTKSDLNDKNETLEKDTCYVSAAKNVGIGNLTRLVSEKLTDQIGERSGLLATTFARCNVSLIQTQTSLRSALQLAENGGGDELIALELREALHQLGEVTGEVYTDDILDRIFSKFCIGK